MALELRIEDVTSRRKNKKILKEQREALIAQEEERKEEREKELEEQKTAFEESIRAQNDNEDEESGDDGREGDDASEGPQFDMEDFDRKFDELNPPIIIPPEVVDDIDNDFNL